MRFHTISRRPGEIGNVVYFDEYVGRMRLRSKAVVTRYEPDKLIEWQMKWVVPWPVRALLSFRPLPSGVEIDHVISIGFKGPLAVLDPIIRLFVPRTFEKELDEHARMEFERLGAFLNSPEH